LPPEALARQSCGFNRVRRGARVVAAHEFEHGHVILPIDARMETRETRDPRVSAAREGKPHARKGNRMNNSDASVPISCANVESRPRRIGDGTISEQALRGKPGGFVAVIESSAFLCECIRMSMQALLSLPVISYSAGSELERDVHTEPAIVMLFAEDSDESNVRALSTLSRIAPRSPVVVFAAQNNPEMARLVFHYGAKGYIPYATEFDLALEAVRFVLSGGTYVPMEYLVLERHFGGPGSSRSSTGPASITVRELDVVRAIQQGKSNKVIAHELNLCETTVKVHVRRIMKKLKAKNRSEVGFQMAHRIQVLDRSQALNLA
jgi:DNA-binding NarL/FixJ family response regulator